VGIIIFSERVLALSIANLESPPTKEACIDRPRPGPISARAGPRVASIIQRHGCPTKRIHQRLGATSFPPPASIAREQEYPKPIESA